MYSVNASFFDQLSSQSAWLLGLLAADGSASSCNPNVLTLSQSGPSGLELVTKVKHLLEYDGRIYSAPTTHQDSHTLTISSPVLRKALAPYGIVPQKTKTLTYPKIPPELHAAFVRGYIDGDGWCNVYAANTTTYLQVGLVGTEAFIEEVNTVVPVAGLIREHSQCKGLYDLRFNGRKAVILGAWLWADKSLPQHTKQAAFMKFVRNNSPRYMTPSFRTALSLDEILEGDM